MANQPKVQVFSELYNLELIQAENVTHSLVRHVHDILCVAIIQNGVRQCQVRGSSQYAAAGQLVIINPGELHACASAYGIPYSYQVLCLELPLVQRLTRGCLEREVSELYFKNTVITDKVSYSNFIKLAEALNTPFSHLERETLLLDFFKGVLYHASENRELKPGNEPMMVRQVKDFIEAHYAEDIMLDELAKVVNFSPYYLHRVFTQHTGLPLRAYQILHRVDNAKKLLRQGTTLAETAIKSGFVDQSHFSRRFKEVMGLTPGVWLKSRIRDHTN